MRIRVLIVRIRVLIVRIRVLIMRMRVLIVRIRVLITALSAQISKRKEDISGSNAILVLLHGQVAPSCSMPPAATCYVIAWCAACCSACCMLRCMLCCMLRCAACCAACCAAAVNRPVSFADDRFAQDPLCQHGVVPRAALPRYPQTNTQAAGEERNKQTNKQTNKPRPRHAALPRSRRRSTNRRAFHQCYEYYPSVPSRAF